MSDTKPDTKADIKLPSDRGETIALMEPLLLQSSDKDRAELADLALELAAKSTGLRRSLPVGVSSALSTLVRAMNCYYSNLIEGHHTHPIDIERALRGDYSSDPEQRDLQLEAKAHIAVQSWIDEDGLSSPATSKDTICDLHRRFCDVLPEELLWMDNPETGETIKVVPGALRDRDVKVGRHVAISPGALPRFFQRFEDAYSGLGKIDHVIASATAHHRLLWMHPFLDGNGRVARLMSYAMLRDALDTGGLWSIARGLARNEADYKRHLAACDLPRRNDLDGRGHLSAEALGAFALFFLNTCLDQVRFMETLVDPSRLRSRILLWAEEEVRMDSLPPKSGAVLEAILYRGQLPRGEVAALLGTGDRQARRVSSALIAAGVVASETSRAPLRLAFPATLAHRWMPGLFPEKV